MQGLMEVEPWTITGMGNNLTSAWLQIFQMPGAGPSGPTTPMKSSSLPDLRIWLSGLDMDTIP